MCQLCTLSKISSRTRWPKPLEVHVADLTRIANSAHHEVTALEKSEAEHPALVENVKAAATSQGTFISTDVPKSTQRATAEKALKSSVEAIALLLQVLEQDRNAWWQSKASARRQWEEQGQVSNITTLNKINNAVKEMLRDMEAKLGVFAKWRLGLDFQG